MNPSNSNPGLISSITELHDILGLQPPGHPLVSIVPLDGVRFTHPVLQTPFRHNYYSITFIKDFKGKMHYGEDYYHINKGLLCISPDQIQSINDASNFRIKGFVFAIHPDFFSNYLPALNMKEYGFFFYSANESLILTKEEEVLVCVLFNSVRHEISKNVDEATNKVIASYVELMLNYCQRFYNRQFISQKEASNRLVVEFRSLINKYFNSKVLQEEGLPTVQYISDALNFTPSYLSDILRTYTGKSTKRHIQDKAIDKAKELLYKTNLTVAEIAYKLGFDYPQNFNKFFKRNTRTSPQKYRLSVRNDIAIVTRKGRRIDSFRKQ